MRLSPQDLRNALRRAGLKPVDKGEFRWRTDERSVLENSESVYLVNYSEPNVMFSNTKTLSVHCPVCGGEICLSLWHMALESWRRSKGTAVTFVSNCCKTSVNLYELHYTPKVYFSNTALTICMTDGAKPPLELIRRLEQVCDAPLDIIERLC